MARIPKLARLLVPALLLVGCEQTIDSPQTQATNNPAPTSLTNQSNSALGGAMRAAERTEDKINDYQERLNREMEGDK